MEQTIDVIIPVYKPDQRLRDLILKLCAQRIRPRYILLINTEKELFDAHLLDGLPTAESFGMLSEKSSGKPSEKSFETSSGKPVILVEHIRKLEFDHGGTRHMAAGMLDGELILFMTQDAVPEDTDLTEALLASFEDPEVCAAYARQLPGKDATLAEQYTRNFNYPSQSRVKSEKDLETLGIKTFFCSNVCAMYRRSAYEENGGFERHTIFNEDMIFAAKLIHAGKKVAYCADARVVHSHNYSGVCQFHRNFDLGVSQAEHPEVFSGIRSEGEGIRLIKKTASHLARKGKPWLICPLIWQSGCKYVGYLLGKNYKRLPDNLVRACSMNKAYWG
ncbi:MAG: glycosyltransferase family 2 protein [Lachnospiraceae bacterium]|nr:glycosyltransferase family 2 protein [Lachnospiraceae bacterium]